MKIIKTSAFNKKFQGRASINAGIKRRLNNAISLVVNGYHERIPLQGIFDALKVEGIVPLQEDGTEWSGFLAGGAECGSDETRHQVANIDLGIQRDGQLLLVPNTSLYISWCVMQSGKYEVIAYVS